MLFVPGSTSETAMELPRSPRLQNSIPGPPTVEILLHLQLSRVPCGHKSAYTKARALMDDSSIGKHLDYENKSKQALNLGAVRPQFKLCYSFHCVTLGMSHNRFLLSVLLSIKQRRDCITRLWYQRRGCIKKKVF